MKRISYSNDTFVTGDAVADKVLEYAKALGRASTDDTVVLPAVDESGRVWDVEVLIGPASQIISRQLDGDEIDLGVEDLLADLDRRITALDRGSRARVGTEADRESNFNPEWDELG